MQDLYEISVLSGARQDLLKYEKQISKLHILAFDPSKTNVKFVKSNQMYLILTLLGLGLIKINDVSANFNNPRPSLILNNGIYKILASDEAKVLTYVYI